MATEPPAGGTDPAPARWLTGLSQRTRDSGHNRAMLYSHTLVEEQADALKSLPDLSQSGQQALRATGTEGNTSSDPRLPQRLARCLALSERSEGTSVGADGQANDEGKGVD